MFDKALKTAAFALMLVSAVYVSGWAAQAAYDTFGGFVDRQTLTQNSLTHTVQSGDTLYGIAERYYPKNEGKMSFAEFYYYVREANPSANRRFLQPGEVVTVNYYTVTKQQ